ncbi:MAG TPA: SMC family ATPase [Streptosporangiaceae bacterium]|nr:SMC family ATPase [Streptosporangiaceae bacterium]
MRPLRLLLDGFGSYREPAEADFSDVEFFALVGPTGAGKSTVIDGVCFALYGTVPRWGKENVIAQALAPAANACRVCLVFESAGKRYGVVRALTRTARGAVQTKEARLELLDPSVPPDAPLADLLAASVEAVAEGPDQVKAAVQEILGLTYDHFTQSVLLPQGRFSEFLHAKAADRQDLLVELLAFGVYNAVGQLARRRAELAADRMRTVQAARDELSGATPEAEASAAARVQDLTGLAAEVTERLDALAALAQRAERAAAEASQAREATALLAAVRMPAELPGLARRIAEAEQMLTRGRQRRDAADEAEATAQAARDALPDLAGLQAWRAARAELADLTVQLDRFERENEARQREQDVSKADLLAAEDGLRQAREDQAQAERAHAAAALAQRLQVGEDCPVCLRPVTALPHLAAPADLEQARRAVQTAERCAGQAQAAHTQAAGSAAAAGRAVEGCRAQIGKVSAVLADSPGEAEISAGIEAIALASAALGEAQRHARACREECAAAEKRRASLGAEERQAQADLGRARDSVVGLGAPAVDGSDLAAAWQVLTGWAQAEQAERSARESELALAASALEAEVTGAQAALAALLAAHGVGEAVVGEAVSANAAAAVVAERERAAGRLAAVRADRAKAARLEQRALAHREEQEVAAELGRLLRATSFERWLCGEALDSLVAEASGTLMELSGGQYQLDRDERNDLVVIDYQDAASRRPVHTLSGGETFQASLALALALSRQVVGLSAGLREMNSMFLDEGFGTLDEDTLETVGTTLERLATDSDRMIGIITHVPALAERVPVRFVVSRTAATSVLRKERVLA